MTIELHDTHTPKRFAPVAKAREGYTLANDYQQKLNGLINAMVISFGRLYQTTPKGLYINIANEGQIVIPLPFSDTGSKNYSGVSVSGQKCLRLMVAETATVSKPKPLFVYDSLATRWYLQVDDYPTERHAINWLKQTNFTLDEFLPNWRKVTNKQTEYKRTQRANARRRA